ncbi:glycosyltransferase family 4 protein [Bacillaceae bacterium]
MKIAIIAPNKGIPVPPKKYGGTERSICDLVEELSKLGQEVILFAEPGSACRAAQIIEYPRRLTDEELAKFIQKKLPPGVDIIHDNTFDATIARRKGKIPTVCTFRNAGKTYPAQYPVFLSRTARRKLNRGRGYYAYNGINLDDYPLCERKKDFLLFLGRPKLHKGIHTAIEIAKRTRQKLVIAGPETEYVRKRILPDNSPYIEYVGSVGGTERLQLLQEAKCLLFPTNCFEAFGRVVIEALACGTPVLASDRGSVPEVLRGFPQLVCRNVREMIRKLKKERFPAPAECREYVRRHFTARKMAKRYLRIYRNVLEQEKKRRK